MPSKKPRSRNLNGRWRKKRSDTGVPRTKLGASNVTSPMKREVNPSCAEGCDLFKEYSHKACGFCPYK